MSSVCLDLCLWHWSAEFFHLLDWSVALKRLGTTDLKQ